MTEKYQILARKYRPQKFLDVVGQKAVVQTLKNSIKYKRTAQAYLFSGSKGIGKTTIARIFAKTLNCQNLTENLEPCNKCSSCLEITSSSSLDVIEIDGASNRGIEDIRQINDTIGYAPSSGKYKIYIIDEVHMLTKEAFNALLKTLEEPPSHVKFFFATTEAHKVLPTILSRCQRYDLTRISIDLIIQNLEKIANLENKKIEKKALFLIARFADGSMRDAKSLLDQLFCYENDTISAESVSNIIGLIPEEFFFALDRAVFENKIAFAFELVQKLYDRGKDFLYFVEQLIEHFRKILIFKTSDLNKVSLPLSQENKQKYISSAKLYKTNQCLLLLDILLNSLDLLQKSSCKRTSLEMLLLKIINSKNQISVQSLVKRLLELEKKIPKNQENNSQVTNKQKPLENKPPIEKPSKKEEKTPQLQKVPFNINEEKKSPPNIIAPTEQVKATPPSTPNKNVYKKPINHYDTLMRFTSVELKGIIKNEGDN